MEYIGKRDPLGLPRGVSGIGVLSFCFYYPTFAWIVFGTLFVVRIAKSILRWLFLTPYPRLRHRTKV
jgi:hypothetical protein